MDCTCKTCVAMCQRPCWPSPSEVLVLMAKGYGSRLMLDWWVSEGDIFIICPACVDREGKQAPEFVRDFRPCTFLKDERCEIHDMKPWEGRVADCSKDCKGFHKEAAMFWNTPEGVTVVREWTDKFLKGD